MIVFRYLFRKLRKRLPALVLLVAAQVGSALLGVAFALGTRGVINAAVYGTRTELVRAAWTQAGIIFGILLCLTLSRWLNQMLTARLDQDWKRELFHRILRGDYARRSEFHTGELINRLNNDVRAVNEGLLSTLPGLASMVTRLAAVVAVLGAMEPWFLAIMAAVGLAAILATGVARRKLQKLNKQVSAADGRVSGFLQEALEKLLLVQAMDVAPPESEKAPCCGCCWGCSAPMTAACMWRPTQVPWPSPGRPGACLLMFLREICSSAAPCGKI